MANSLNTGTRDIPLKFSKELSEIVNREWVSGGFMSAVSPITSDLLRFWFDPAFCDVRGRNFHIGQRQAILNTIYVHEVLKSDSVSSMYSAITQDAGKSIADGTFVGIINESKYRNPKYCVKMATGTGKTWVLNALMIWQYLNAKYSAQGDVKFTKNFLLVAPGLIVYERLLDAFLGKETPNGERDFTTSDIYGNKDLFLPDRYRDDIFSFVQNSVSAKSEIGHKTTADGIIAITNWHALQDEEETLESEVEIAGVDLNDTKSIVKDLLPLTPGVSAGNSLDTLDAGLLRGGMLEYLKNLPDICVFNDEAHHIHENKTYGVINEVEWQKSMNAIADGKARNFIQIDFSATPYDVTGSGEKRTKHYFPHIVVDFELRTAMLGGLVKMFALDERKEIASLSNEEIDFKAVRNEAGKVIGLSEGQRLLLRAGLSRLRILESDFDKINQNKFPKMLIVCEDTNVSPHVIQFLQAEGLQEDDILQIDSNKKGELGEKEWGAVKQKLFSLDKQKQPKVVVSVLMLREGFDVSNVCVIVPLRSSQAPILLEQVLGRGLRLMWREPDYSEIKAENRRNVYELKQEPKNYLDTLFVVEHPAFKQFYDDLDKDLVITEKEPRPDSGSSLGDIISVGLRDNYKDYDMFWPQILRDREETLNGEVISVDKMQPLEGWSLEQLKTIVPNDNDERFVAQELMVKTHFGEYRVRGDIFTATSYNEYLQKMLNAVSANFAKISANNRRTELPLMQIDQGQIVSAIDKFIRTRLFEQLFDPMADGNWRILLMLKGKVIEHTMREISKAIYNMQNNINVTEAVVEKQWFSNVDNMIGRENYALNIVKSIYSKTFYPSNKGGLEKEFMITADSDSRVEKIIKINENKHVFARFRYLRSDGMLSTYYPDFMLKIGEKIYVVETKGNNTVSTSDVQSKQRGALDWVAKINELRPEDRMGAEWSYVLLTDTNFYALRDKGASIQEILEFSKLTHRAVEGRLF